MTVSAITSALAPQGTSPTAKISSDFDTFLKMLTVQIQNQDPMNPMQSTEFAAQLATFSGVEQQVRTNQQLAELSQTLSVSTMAQLSGWIGMEARVDAPVAFDGTPVTLSPNPPALADSAFLVVLDANGNEVMRTPMQLGSDPILWHGLDAFGATLPPGRYQLRQEAFAQGESLGVQPVAHYALVSEARANGQGGIALVLEGGVSVPAAGATALRKPEGI